MRRMGIGLGVGINRSNYAQGIFGAYQSRVVADGGVVEGGSCVDAVTGLLQSASLLLIPSGYKANKLYSEIPTNGNGDLTWTRTSTAIRTNSSGLLESMATGVPRLSYMYGSCPSALLEPQRTNLALYSSAVGGTGWTIISAGIGVSPTVTTNYAVAPDGNTTASRLQLSLGSGTSTSDQSLVVQTLTGTSCRGSFYIKTNDGSTKTIYVRGNLAYSIVIDGTWKRYDFDAGTLSSTQFGIGLRGGQTPTNSNTADILVWGAQLEVGAYPTTYIPTTSATATRVADTATVTGVSSLIGQSAGTIYIQFSGRSTGTNSRVITITGGSKEFLLFYEPAGTGNLGVFSTNTGLFYIDTGGANDKMYKIAFAYEANNYALYVNGVSRSITQSANTFGSLSRIDLNQKENGTEIGLTIVNQLALFTTRLTNSQLASLTTL